MGTPARLRSERAASTSLKCSCGPTHGSTRKRPNCRQMTTCLPARRRLDLTRRRRVARWDGVRRHPDIGSAIDSMGHAQGTQHLELEPGARNETDVRLAVVTSTKKVRASAAHLVEDDVCGQDHRIFDDHVEQAVPGPNIGQLGEAQLELIDAVGNAIETGSGRRRIRYCSMVGRSTSTCMSTMTRLT